MATSKSFICFLKIFESSEKISSSLFSFIKILLILSEFILKFLYVKSLQIKKTCSQGVIFINSNT